MKILFVTNEIALNTDRNNQSVRYRCWYPSIALKLKGIESEVVTSRALIRKIDYSYDVYVFHSPSYSLSTSTLIKRLRKAEKIVIADFDDLVFDPENARDSIYAFHEPAKTDAKYALKRVMNHRKAMDQFENFICSNSYLAKEIETIIGKRPKVFHLAMPDTHISLHAKYRTQKKIPGTIAFAHGSKSSSPALEDAAQQLEDFLIRNPKKKVVFIGNADFAGSPLNSLSNFIRLNRISYPEYLTKISKLQKLINFQNNNAVSMAKSRVKAFEANILGVHCVSTKLPDYENAVADGLRIDFVSTLNEGLYVENSKTELVDVNDICNSHGSEYLVKAYTQLGNYK